jgi:hypothetical protein
MKEAFLFYTILQVPPYSHGELILLVQYDWINSECDLVFGGVHIQAYEYPLNYDSGIDHISVKQEWKGSNLLRLAPRCSPSGYW